MHTDDINGLGDKVKELKSRLKIHIKDRKHRLGRFKRRTLLTDEQVLRYGADSHVKDLHEILLQNECWSGHRKSKIAVRCRNHLMFMLCLGNALRTSNLVNVNLEDVVQAKIEPEFNNARSVSSEFYKTSMLYGEKIIMFPPSIYKQVLFYINHLRPVLVDYAQLPEDKRYLFVTKGTSSKMTHSSVANALTAAVKITDILQNEGNS